MLDPFFTSHVGLKPPSHCGNKQQGLARIWIHSFQDLNRRMELDSLLLWKVSFPTLQGNRHDVYIYIIYNIPGTQMRPLEFLFFPFRPWKWPKGGWPSRGHGRYIPWCKFHGRNMTCRLKFRHFQSLGVMLFFDWIVYNLAGSKGTRLHMGQHLFKPTFTWVCRKKKLDDYWWILEGKLWNLRTPGISMTSFPYVVLFFWDSHRTLVNIEHVHPTVLLQQSVPWSSWALNLEGQQNTCVYI